MRSRFLRSPFGALLLAIFFGEAAKMFYDIWIPVDLFGQLLTGKRGADPAKRYSVRLSTRVNGTSSRLFPLFAVSVRLNAPSQIPFFFFSQPVQHSPHAVSVEKSISHSTGVTLRKDVIFPDVYSPSMRPNSGS